MDNSVLLGHLELIQDHCPNTLATDEEWSNWQKHAELWFKYTQARAWLNYNDVLPVSGKLLFVGLCDFYREVEDRPIASSMVKQIMQYFLRGWVEEHYLTSHPDPVFISLLDEWPHRCVFISPEEWLDWRIISLYQKLLGSSGLAYVDYAIKHFTEVEWFDKTSEGRSIFKEVFRPMWHSGQSFNQLKLYEKLLQKAHAHSTDLRQKWRWLSLLQVGLAISVFLVESKGGEQKKSFLLRLNDVLNQGYQSLMRESKQQGFVFNEGEVWSEFCFSGASFSLEDALLNWIAWRDKSLVHTQTDELLVVWVKDNLESIHKEFQQVDPQMERLWHEDVLLGLSSPTALKAWVLAWMPYWNHGAWKEEHPCVLRIKRVLGHLSADEASQLTERMDQASDLDFSQLWKELYLTQYALVAQEDDEKGGEGKTRRRL